MASKPFEINGKHVLIALVLFFGAIIGVNAIMVTLAVQSFPGEERKKSYLQGLNYNDVLAERAAQAASGVRIVLPSGAQLDAGTANIDVQVLDGTGEPVRGLALEGQLFRPTTDREALSLSFTPLDDGTYRAELEGLGLGAWDLTVTGVDAAGQPLAAERRLWIE